MPLSRNLFKQGELLPASQHKKIETTHIPKVVEVESLKLSGADIAGDNLSSVAQLKKLEQQFHEIQQAKINAAEELAVNEREKLTQELKVELVKKKAAFMVELAELKKRTLAEAEAQALGLKSQALKDSFELGMKDGYQTGFAEGVANGLAQGQAEARLLKESAQKLFTESQAEVQQYQISKQQELIDLSIAMAEKIIHREISLSQDDLFLLLEPFINQLNTVENFVTVYVRKAKLNLFQRKLEELKNQQPALKYVVLVDDDLEENGVIMETDYEVLDLQIKKQLQGILNALNEVKEDDVI